MVAAARKVRRVKRVNRCVFYCLIYLYYSGACDVVRDVIASVTVFAVFIWTFRRRLLLVTSFHSRHSFSKVKVKVAPYSLLTSPTRTRQNCLVLSCPCRRREQNWRQDKTVLSCCDPVSNLHLFSLDVLRTTENLEIGNCLVLSPIVFTPPTRTRQDSFVLSVSAVWTSY